MPCGSISSKPVCCLGWVISNKNINLHPQLQTMFSMLSLDVPSVLAPAFSSLADRYPFSLKLHSLCVCVCVCVIAGRLRLLFIVFSEVSDKYGGSKLVNEKEIECGNCGKRIQLNHMRYHQSFGTNSKLNTKYLPVTYTCVHIHVHSNLSLNYVIPLLKQLASASS